MILALRTRLSPTARWAIAIAVGLLLIGGLILWLGAREKADDESNQEIGATVEREAAQAETITRTERANHAEEAIRSDPDARLANCRLYSRTPANCR